MPSPEQRYGHEPPERESASYSLAARFRDEVSARPAYTQAQEAIFATPCELSVFRLQINDFWHVAAVGDPPPPALDGQLRGILAAGQPATLPAEVLTLLGERRRQIHKQQGGRWYEGHYKPGKRL